MTKSPVHERGFSKPLAIFSLSIAAIAVALLFFGGTIRRFVRESLMQRVTSAHYEILCPPGALSQRRHDGIRNAKGALVHELWTKSSAMPIQTWKSASSSIPIFLGRRLARLRQQPYSVTGTTIRTRLNGRIPQLPAAADAEALLYAAWGKPGNAQIARWTAIWLVGDWHGAEIGMAAAQVEQRLGHKKLVSVLRDPGGEISSPDDQSLARRGMDQRNRRIRRRRHGPETLRRKDAASQRCRSDESVRHDSAGARSQMADVDVRISGRNACDAARFRHADGYADAGKPVRGIGW